jgi:hypothetical protein
MKMANNLKRLTAVFLGIFVGSSGALAFDNYKEFRRDRWDFEINSNFFYSEANYENFGDGSTNLSSGNHYQLLNVDFGTRYMPSRNWSLFAVGTMSMAESKNSVATRTNSTFSQFLGGFDFMMYNGAFQLVPELAFVVPFQEVDVNSDEVLSNEGVLQFLARVNAQKDFGTLRAYGWIGFNYRGDERSYLMPWGGGLQLKFDSVRLGGEIFGAQSITDDKDTNNKTARNAHIAEVDAGSYKFYSVNPSVVDSNFYATWVVNPQWSLQANVGTTIAGENAAAGFHVGGFIRYSFDMAAGYSQDFYTEPPPSTVPSGKSQMYNPQDQELGSETKVKKFREDTNDGVDQQQFKARPTKKKPRPKTNENLQNQLDDVEFQIELKNKGH